MDEAEFKNWERIKSYFESLPEHKRDNMFYKRACSIVQTPDNPVDPIDHPQ